jgi:uncharacterized membrane protein YbaN (DUF454 family)
MIKKNIKRMFRLLKIIIGGLLVVIGIAGLFLPIMPGIILIIIGVVLIDSDKINKYFKKKFRKLKGK